MFIVGILSWWYTAGWQARLLVEKERMASLLDYFSFGLLLTTLFSPFRQISAGKVQGSIGTLWRAFVDRLISRFIGAIVRTLVLLAGIIVVCIVGILSLSSMLLWPLIPFLPFVGATMMLIGWTPSWI
jgi:hypothetical protein